jgi:hypothetical protein
MFCFVTFVCPSHNPTQPPVCFHFFQKRKKISYTNFFFKRKEKGQKKENSVDFSVREGREKGATMETAICGRIALSPNHVFNPKPGAYCSFFP